MSAMTKKEWMEYIEKTWDAAQKEAWSEPQFECPRCGHCCQAEVNKEAMKLALEALESDPISHAGLVNRKQAITALRQALVDADDTSQERVDEKAKREHEWVGLTDEERHNIREWQEIQKELGPVWAPMLLYLYEAIEAKLREKNT